jgi:hypothetical protein
MRKLVVNRLSLGALMNCASQSSWERVLWRPVALKLSALCLALARGADASGG